eukprot:scaffold62300_cov54-Attheya_sp.AAC.4
MRAMDLLARNSAVGDEDVTGCCDPPIDDEGVPTTPKMNRSDTLRKDMPFRGRRAPVGVAVPGSRMTTRVGIFLSPIERLLCDVHHRVTGTQTS